jgi:hypothetical protein
MEILEGKTKKYSRKRTCGKRTYSGSYHVDAEYPFRFASSHSSYFESAVVAAVAAYIAVVVAAVAAASLLVSESKPSASGRDAVVACASAFLVPYRDAAVVVPVQANPLSPYAFVDRVAELFA